MAKIKEQRVCIKFCLKLGKSVTETLQMLQSAHKESARKQSALFDWHKHKHFKERGDSVKDDNGQAGQPHQDQIIWWLLFEEK